MEATSVIPFATVSSPKAKATIAKTVARVLKSACTSSPVDIPEWRETDYSEAQFSADLRKASKKLDLMVAKALKEHAEGKTRKFPV